MGIPPSQDLVDGYAFRVDRQDPYLRVLCVNIFVRNQDRSLRFYVDQLGFGLVIDESYESGGRWVSGRASGWQHGSRACCSQA